MLSQTHSSQQARAIPAWIQFLLVCGTRCCSSRQVLLFPIIPYPSPSHFASSEANLSLPLSLGTAWGGMASPALSLCPSTELCAGIFPGNCCPQSPARPWTKSLSLRVPAGLCWAAAAPHLSLLMESVSETLRVLLPDHPASSWRVPVLFGALMKA